MSQFNIQNLKSKIVINLSSTFYTIQTGFTGLTRFLTDFYPKHFDRNLIEIFFVNPHEFHFENDIIIYENKVAIVSLNPDELIGVIIESPVYARTEKSVFGLAWLGATAFVAR